MLTVALRENVSRMVPILSVRLCDYSSVVACDIRHASSNLQHDLLEEGYTSRLHGCIKIPGTMTGVVCKFQVAEIE